MATVSSSEECSESSIQENKEVEVVSSSQGTEGTNEISQEIQELENDYSNDVTEETSSEGQRTNPGKEEESGCVSSSVEVVSQQNSQENEVVTVSSSVENNTTCEAQETLSVSSSEQPLKQTNTEGFHPEGKKTVLQFSEVTEGECSASDVSDISIPVPATNPDVGEVSVSVPVTNPDVGEVSVSVPTTNPDVGKVSVTVPVTDPDVGEVSVSVLTTSTDVSEIPIPVPSTALDGNDISESKEFNSAFIKSCPDSAVTVVNDIVCPKSPPDDDDDDVTNFVPSKCESKSGILKPLVKDEDDRYVPYKHEFPFDVDEGANPSPIDTENPLKVEKYGQDEPVYFFIPPAEKVRLLTHKQKLPDCVRTLKEALHPVKLEGTVKKESDSASSIKPEYKMEWELPEEIKKLIEEDDQYEYEYDDDDDDDDVCWGDKALRKSPTLRKLVEEVADTIPSNWNYPKILSRLCQELEIKMKKEEVPLSVFWPNYKLKKQIVITLKGTEFKGVGYSVEEAAKTAAKKALQLLITVSRDDPLFDTCSEDC